MEAYEDDFYDDDDFEALDREMEHPPKSSHRKSFKAIDVKVAAIPVVEDFSEFDDLPNLAQTVTRRRASLLTDSPSANQLLLAILPNTIINTEEPPENLEKEFAPIDVQEGPLKQEVVAVIDGEQSITDNNIENETTSFNAFKLSALKKKAQAKAHSHNKDINFQYSEETKASKPPEIGTVLEIKEEATMGTEIRTSSVIAVPKGTQAPVPVALPKVATKVPANAANLKPAPPSQPKPSRLKPVVAPKTLSDKEASAEVIATVSPAASSASIVSQSVSDVRVGVALLSMNHGHKHHPSSDTVATNFSADHVTVPSLLSEQHGTSLAVLDLHPSPTSEQDLIPETLQKAVQEEALQPQPQPQPQKPHPPAPAKTEQGSKQVAKAAPHRRKKASVVKADSVAKEKAKDWIKNPKYRYDEASGLFSTFETEAQRESRLEVQKQVQLARQQEREREIEEARIEYAQKLEERKHRRMQRAIPPAKIHPAEHEQISPRSHVTEKVEALKAMKKLKEDKATQEKDDLRLRLEYLSQAAFQSKDKYVRNSYQIFGPPVGFKGFVAPPATKSKHPIPSRFVSPPRNGSPTNSLHIGTQSVESIEGQAAHRMDTKMSLITVHESRASMLPTSRRNSHDASYLTEGSVDVENDCSAVSEDADVSRLKFDPSVVSIHEDIDPLVDVLVVDPLMESMIEEEVVENENDEEGEEGYDAYADEDFADSVQVYEDVFDNAHLMQFEEGTIRIKSFYAESPNNSAVFSNVELISDAWTLDDAFRKLDEKKSAESIAGEDGVEEEELSVEERYITKYPVDEDEPDASDSERYEDTFEGSRELSHVMEADPEPDSKPDGDTSFHEEQHSVHFEASAELPSGSAVRLKSPPLAKEDVQAEVDTEERPYTTEYYEGEDFEVDNEEMGVAKHGGSLKRLESPPEPISIVQSAPSSAKPITAATATRSSSAAYEDEFESYDDDFIEFD